MTKKKFLKPTFGYVGMGAAQKSGTPEILL